MNKKELWLRLKNYQFEDVVAPNMWTHIQSKFGIKDASTQAFAHKLASKRSWSNAFAHLAIREYKKFIYLGIISDFVVTPSLVIDQVWHQHLLFSKAYRHFCQNVIQYDFDHNPELITIDDQTSTFSAQYMDTLKLYKTEFGYEPPPNFWNRPKFERKILRAVKHQSKKKKELALYNNMVMDGTPLYQAFNTDDSSGIVNFEGGDAGGAGASGNWSDNANSDSTSSDSGSSSSCSSGCGGGD